MIKKTFLMILISVISTSLIAKQGDMQEVNQTLLADEKSNIQIEHVVGKATISAWSKNEVSVVGKLSNRTKEFQFERNGNAILIKVDVNNHRKNGWNWHNGDGDQLTIMVPVKSRVNYTALNSDVTIQGITGGVDIEVVNGDVDVSDLQGKIRIEAVNGDIATHHLNGDIRISTVNGDVISKQSYGKEIMFDSVNGDITADSANKEVVAQTVNGDINLSLDIITDIELITVNGAIDVSMALADKGIARANSVGGEIMLVFQKDVSAKFNIDTHAGGAIVNHITDEKQQKAKYGPERGLNFITGDASANVDIETVHGRVILKTR